jgi:hypothetical protein
MDIKYLILKIFKRAKRRVIIIGATAVFLIICIIFVRWKNSEMQIHLIVDGTILENINATTVEGYIITEENTEFKITVPNSFFKITSLSFMVYPETALRFYRRWKRIR